MITPNRLTFFRLLIAVILPILLLWKRVAVSEVIVIIGFTVACITDWWDGYLARKKSLVSWVGKIADPIADKTLILGLMFTFWHFGLYSFWWIFFIVVREISVTAVRLFLLSKGRAIAAEKAGKFKVGFQIASVSCSLFLMLSIDGNWPQWMPLFFFGLNYFLIFLANILTIVSGVLFFKNLKRREI